MLRVKKLKKEAILPERANSFAAGYDLYLPIDMELSEGLHKINLQFSMELPRGHYARIACRSSLAARGFSVEAGVIDEDYRGPVTLMLRSRKEEYFPYGYKIAQMIVTPYASPEVKEVESLSETSRGDGGFGSTGSKQTDAH